MDILAAIFAAVADGVQVLSLSIGGPAADYVADLMALGTLYAVNNGVTVVCSAGNSGPQPGSVSNLAPWMLTVAASTMDRDFPAHVTFGNSTNKGRSLSNTAPSLACGRRRRSDQGQVPRLEPRDDHRIHRRQRLQDETGGAATPFSYGSGHLNPVPALDPGLVYDTAPFDYANFLKPTQTQTQTQSFNLLPGSLPFLLPLFMRSNSNPFKCSLGVPFRPQNLNYPSISATCISGSTTGDERGRRVQHLHRRRPAAGCGGQDHGAAQHAELR
ncbi:hypothetical protein ACQ4PT_016567 [Festuca glaucescens]